MTRSTFRFRSRRVARRALASGAMLLTAAACSDSTHPVAPAPIDLISNEVVLTWNTVAHDVLVAHDGYLSPLPATRVLTMVHTAQHDAINSIDPRFERYALEGYPNAADTSASPVAAAAAAAHGVLAALFPDQRGLLDVQLALSLGTVADGPAETRGIELGEAAAAAILALRQDDGADTPVIGDYVPGNGPGKYQPTPPYGFASTPGWRFVTPFVLTSPSQFRSAPPPALGSEAYASAFAEVKAVGQAGSTTRTADQSAYAKFWYELSEIGWNRIGRTAAAEQDLGLQSTARLFALLNMAMADAYIAGWDSKYHHDFWRPYTAIREAAGDGNDATEPDATWEPAEPTPPVQDYPSTHSALGDAAAEVLASVFGDETSFTATSTSADPAHPTRSFGSFSQAADENADSRVMAGIHFRFATDAGQELGRKIGQRAVATLLRAR